jgi:hypothetical protein
MHNDGPYVGHAPRLFAVVIRNENLRFNPNDVESP